MPKVLWKIVLLVVLFASYPALGDEKKWYEKITLGGELRIRSETQLDYGPLTGGVDDDSFVLLRARPHLDAKPIDGIRIFIQPQFSRAFAQEESTIAGNADAGNPNNVFDLHQGFLDLNQIGGSVASLRLGRQELIYGEERLVGAFNWSNIGRSFDAGKIRLEWERFSIDGFFAWNEKAAGNEYFTGLYGSWKVRPNMTFEGYSLLLWDNDGDGAPGVTGTKIVTIGDRLAGTLWNEKFDYSVEATLQVGKTEPNNHLAYAAHVATGYTFTEAAWKPRLGIEYNLASGNDPGTAKVERFNNLFPTNHDKYGYIDFASWRNIHDIVASTSVKPVTGLLLKLDYHLFLLPEPADGIFRASGTQLRAGVAGASRLAGHEIDFLAKYQWNKWVNFLAGYSLFQGGEFFSDTGTNGTAHFAYVQTQANF
jgi:hypothetical protein